MSTADSSSISTKGTSADAKPTLYSTLLVLLVAAPLGLGLLVTSGFTSTHATEPSHASAPEEHGGGGEHHELEEHRIVVTRPLEKDVVLTEQYVCQIHSRRHIQIRAMSEGYLDEIHVNEGQAVEKDDLLFRIRPVLYQARYDAELAEARLAELEVQNAKRLLKQNIVSPNEVALLEAKLAKARAEARQAEAELAFTSVRAPFSGIVDRLEMQLGSLIDKGEDLTSLSDNSVLWVYFNVPEARYLDYMESKKKPGESQSIELQLANGKTFIHKGTIGAIEAKFNNETGNIPFRADFPNPDGLLRHGQTGTVLLHHTMHGALVIPQRATFEILDRRYVYVVDDERTVHQRPIVIEHELDDVFVLASGLTEDDQIVLEGLRQVFDGEKLDDFDTVKPEKALSNLKYPAE